MLTELIDLPGGTFTMGSTAFYPDESPVHTATVAAFAIERHPVTNAQYAEFVADTGYVTVAERPLDPALYPGVAAAVIGTAMASVGIGTALGAIATAVLIHLAFSGYRIEGRGPGGAITPGS